MNRTDRRYLYYSGILESQYSTPSTADGRFVGDFITRSLQLEPRFRLLQPIDCTEEVCDSEIQIQDAEFKLAARYLIKQEKQVIVEFEQDSDFINKYVLKIWFLNHDSVNNTSLQDIGGIKPVLWDDMEKNTLVPRSNLPEEGVNLNYFKAYEEGSLHHGKLRGKAILKVPNPDYRERHYCAYVYDETRLRCDNEVPVLNGLCPLHVPPSPPPVQCAYIIPDTQKRCENTFYGIEGDFCHIHQQDQNKQCLYVDQSTGARCPNSLPVQGPDVCDAHTSNVYPCWDSSGGCLSGGCLGLTLPGGVNSGCGCLGALLGLLLLLWFIWCVILGNCGNGIGRNTQPTIIRDTVFVEVIREVKDTLMIIETDTIALIDSTVREISVTLALPNVQFFTDSDKLLPSSAQELSTVVNYLIDNPEARGVIYGHTDSIGNNQHNLELSQRRAESVKDYFVSFNIDPNRLQAVGEGETKPKASNATPEGRLMNRRVEMEIITSTKEETTRIQVDPDSLDRR